MPRSRRAAAAMLALGLALAAALALGTALPVVARLASVTLLASFMVPALARLAGRGGPVTFGVDADGRWWLRQGDGARDYVRFAGRPLVLGEWVWLHFQGSRGRVYVFIDGPLMEPRALRRLKVRLRLDPDDSGRR